LVARAVLESERRVERCLDPFGGSGTAALACQFLGIDPVTIEVNPYLADLIEAKLTSYDAETLARDAGRVVDQARRSKVDPHQLLQGGPATLVEPGHNERWVYDREVARNILALRDAIEGLENQANRRLFKAILGGQLVDLSNVCINGKGRRYRGGWQDRRVPPERVYAAFVDALSSAVQDIALHRNRASLSYDLRRGDARTLVEEVPTVDLVVFSPPYPNSFDYTDVYNLELWMLGYLREREDNSKLRQSTLTSHVQLRRNYARPPVGSPLLDKVLDHLNRKQGDLWHRDIPAMVGAYFADLFALLSTLRHRLNAGGRIYMVVGDSQYAGVLISVASILSELAVSLGYEVLDTEACRSMRASAQQGGAAVLPETLLVLA
jgi:hypothetical protein